MEKNVAKTQNSEFSNMIDALLPDRIFDAHMHISHVGFSSSAMSSDGILDLASYRSAMSGLIGGRELFCNAITYPVQSLENPEELSRSVSFLASQMELDPTAVGEVMVMPWDSIEDIEKRLVHPQIRGLKCYWIYSKSGAGDQSDIGDFLPRAAWEVANARGLYITLHMVKDRALADTENLSYIKTMARQYPNVTLILAHCARAFAAWTVFDTVDELVGLPGVMFDFSGIAESPAMSYIIKRVGIKRCMWGSDSPISEFIGKPISIADTFHWIVGTELALLKGGNLPAGSVGAEGLLAFRQTVKILDLSASDVEDFFYHNAKNLFYR